MAKKCCCKEKKKIAEMKEEAPKNEVIEYLLF